MGEEMGEGGEGKKKKERESDDNCHHLSISFSPPIFFSPQLTPMTTGDHQRACTTSGQGLAARSDAGVGDRGETPLFEGKGALQPSLHSSYA